MEPLRPMLVTPINLIPASSTFYNMTPYQNITPPPVIVPLIKPNPTLVGLEAVLGRNIAKPQCSKNFIHNYAQEGKVDYSLLKYPDALELANTYIGAEYKGHKLSTTIRYYPDLREYYVYSFETGCFTAKSTDLFFSMLQQ
jgi:hypothetical protein